MTRRALLVSWHFPPRYSIGGKRAHRFARYLPEHGWNTVVLTAAAPAWERVDPSFDDHELAGCEVRRTLLTPRELVAMKRVAYGSDGTIEAPTTWKRPATGVVARTRRELRLVPIIGSSTSKLPWLAARVAREARRAGAEIVLASGPPWEIVVASTVAARALGLPVVVDFRDPWSFGPLVGQRPTWVRAADALVERGVLAAAAAMVVTSEATRAEYARRGLARRVVCVRTGFDGALRPAGRPAPTPTLVHFGNCYAGRRLEPFLRAVARVTRPVRVLNLGRVADEDLALARDLGVADRFEHRAVVPYADGLEIVAGADLALLPGIGDEPWFIPGKLYDYLAARVPILAVATSSDVVDLLGSTRAGFVHDVADVAGIAARIDAMLDARARGERLLVPDEAALAALDARSLARDLARVLADAARRA